MTCRIIVAAIVAVMMPEPAAAQPALTPGKTTAYYCVQEAVGGVVFDEKSKQWTGTRFKPNDKFVLRVTFLGYRSEKATSPGGKDYMVSDYRIAATEAGSSVPMPCVGRRDDDAVSVSSYSDTMVCDLLIYNFRFNLKTNRYLKAYLEGYVGGEDNNSNTPGVGIGTCTRISD